jgi:ankyrin repeat protein
LSGQKKKDPVVFSQTKKIEQFSSVLQRGDVSQIQQMVEAGFDLDEQLRDNQAALHIALTSGSVDLCRAIVRLGADVNLQFPTIGFPDTRGYSPLHYSTQQHSLEKTQLLLERGADPRARSWYGCTPAHSLLQDLPKSEDDVTCLSALLAAGADPNATITQQIRVSREADLTNWFAGKAGDVQSNLTVLHCAVLISAAMEAKDPAAARLRGCHGARLIDVLLQHGADPNFMPENPRRHYLTPLQMAVKIGSADDVRVLLESPRADRLQKTVSGASLLQLAGRSEIQAVLRSFRTAALVSETYLGKEVDHPLEGAVNSDSIASKAPGFGAL